ncbi:family 16 glycoside hydrolase [Pelagicoccus sp. SDUM812002]|uniref:family 16 glycoside hydrolase n=1 Tax=Pelagicoccus sp. SDUM812002 TaxID=3041266 RepID=UPI00280FC013|nr:family 16 glycoside hydrolase [Pelagicoccus sp. SDUM812002]MDQ8186035.1 DUF1080 domain-containing protein [Pelagicoccus sp. SDUM812002]
MIRPPNFLKVAVVGFLLATLFELQAAPLGKFIDPADAWNRASSIELSDDSTHFRATESASGDIYYTDGFSGENGYLLTLSNYSDQIVSFEYLVPEDSQAGVYLQGRYEVKLSTDAAGTLAGGTRDDESFDPHPPRASASNPVGQWNKITIRFRTFRSDETFNKLANATFLEVTLNGESVHDDAQIPNFTPGSIREWEQFDGPLAFRAANGPIAFRNFQIDHADYSAVEVPEPGQLTNETELVDQVQLGKETFTGIGCIECHTTKKGDTSFKTGPNLFGLFQKTPKKHEVHEPASDARFSIEANLTYAKRSIRNPAVELAITSAGPNAGQPYLPIMVPYSEEMLSNAKADAIYRYLSTLNDDAQRGPVEFLVAKDGPTEYDPIADTMQVLVKDRTRIQRGSMKDVSGRSIHVGLPIGLNYTFDPRTLAIEKVWQGGFLNGAGEWENRGGSGFEPGYENKGIGLPGKGGLLSPLGMDGEHIDFSFKESKLRDFDTINASLNSEQDHLELLAEIDARFLGYTLPSQPADASPTFHYRVGKNNLSMQTVIEKDGSAKIHLSGNLSEPQTFKANIDTLHGARVSHGSLDEEGLWTLPATNKLKATLSGEIGLAALVWRPEPTDADYLEQKLIVQETEAVLPLGYRSEQYLPPHDNFGRDLLFEATAIDVAPDGTIVVGTRTSGIWRIVNGQWQLFAEGLFDCLGLVVEDESGLTIVAGQKPELTRISDTDGDGIADTFETLSDQFSYHSNYHSYMHGPVRDAAGNYYYNLNLLHADEAIFKGGGLYMGSSGGYSGWTIKVTPEGEFIPWASGLRSPAGLGIDPQGTLWYADNQGEYVGTSKLFILEENKYYGHPSGLVDLPGMKPDSAELRWPAAGANRETAVALFPHNKVANSPGHMAWDTTEGEFGPFAGQMFIGDQTQSKLLRVATYQVEGETRAAVIPFGENLQSGIMRPVFLGDGSLLLGQTGRGWQAQGGKIASLQRLVWDGKTVAQAIHSAKLSADLSTITVQLTQPLSSSVSAEQLQSLASTTSWMYRDAPDYGSPELDTIEHSVNGVKLSSDRKQVTLTLAPETYATQEFRTSRVYHLKLKLAEELEAYITSK